MQTGYYATNPLTEIAALRARVAALEKALLASRGAGPLGAALAGISGDTPTAALPNAEDIEMLYLVEEDSHDIYRLMCRVVNGKARLYLQRVGRSRQAGE